MASKSVFLMLGLMLIAQQSMAGTQVSVLGIPAGGTLPLGIAGITGIAAVSLVLGVQLIKRKKK